MEILQNIQLNVMLVLSGVCFALAVCGLISDTTKRKNHFLFFMDISAALLMISDRYAYIFRGDGSPVGFWMVRLCNFLVFFLTLSVIFCFNGYVRELCKSNPDISHYRRRLKVNEYLLMIGVVLLVVSQFTGLYYTFDASNFYQRADGYMICYLIPMIAWLICISVLVQNHSVIGFRTFIVLMLFCTLPIIASIAQLFFYGLSLNNITITLVALILRLFELRTAKKELYLANKRERDSIIRQEESTRRLFAQTATALVNAIDAKDKYTHGHSARVAEYSRKLAEMNGKSERECDEIYYSALVHDVGKIGIPRSILSKDSRLTDEEYATIKQHPVMGVQILEGISEFPSLSIGAHYHHERYDGRGYPEGLKGTEIPEMARIIAVADAYDAMTSKRSYRDPIPQQKVREEIVKGTGTQFDPVYARLMLHLIDDDLEYQMSERSEIPELDSNSEFVVGEYKSKVSDGILLNSCLSEITLSVMSDEEASGAIPAPSVLLFDSLDGKAHSDPKEIKDLNYFEYAEITFDLKAVTLGARKIEMRRKEVSVPDITYRGSYKIEAVRIKDHALVRIYDKESCAEFIIALPDCTRYAYLGLTGEHCRFTDIEYFKSVTPYPEHYIPRIAEMISFIDAPAGDIPNVQVDDYRTAHSEGIKIEDGLKITFHSKCLPTARLVWHCPFIDIFSSDDGAVNGATYHDLAFMRFDGECWECDDECCRANLNTEKNDEFKGWDTWKQFNRDGFDAAVTFRAEDNKITVMTENGGIAIRNEFVITGINKPLYTAVTGDQVAITNIRISRTQREGAPAL